MKIKQAEKYVKKLKSVISCKIIVDKQNNIEEIHILANTQREPKQISRDVQSVLVSEFGMEIDYKKISIAQIEKDVVESDNFRLKFSTVQYSITGKKADIEVILRKGDNCYKGRETGLQTKYNSEKMIATATLKAVEDFLGIEDMFLVEDVKTVEIAHKDVVVTGIVFLKDNEEQFFTGTSTIYRDKKETIVKATLDGINRKIMQYHNGN